MKRIALLFAAAAGVAVTMFAAQPAELDRAASAIAGSEAHFTQKFTPKGFKNPQAESGTVLFGKLPMMRWSYTTPETKLFVFNGEKSWFYVADDKQVTVSTVNDERRREMPFLVIGDPEARNRNFVIREQTSGDAIVTSLQPRDRSSAILSIEVTTGTTDHRIRSIRYADREGNQTSFELSAYHAKDAGAAAFTFTPGPGVQIVQQ